MSTAAVVALAGVILLAFGMVANQLLRLRKWLNNPPAAPPAPEEPPDERR
ncbi:hypothetical protein [Mycobacterium helveticum]|nr:hypothetical protein [Mycobacterium helveticum]